MVNKDNKLPILCNGESLAEPIVRVTPGAPKNYPKDYRTAKELLLLDIKAIEHSIERNVKKKYVLDEFIVCVRMAKGFIAKSYEPEVVNRDNAMEFVGARKYSLEKTNKVDGEKEETSKLYFMRTTKAGLKKFEENLRTDKFESIQTTNKQICSIEKIDLLLAEEKVLGFDEDWNNGRVEMIIHPFEQSKDKAIKIVHDIVSQDSNSTVLIREYENGPIFISAKINKGILEEISQYNFLRTVHPLRAIELPSMRMVNLSERSPIPISTAVKSNIKVGVFDGGAQEDNPLLKDFITIHNDIIKTAIDSNGIAHGSAVSGAILYGPLNKYSSKSTVDMPVISVESFRVLPTSNPNDFDLYEVIDVIENVVNDRTDIDIYNISLGPPGPILDDQISRFTYSLDKLAYQHDVLFCVAVGNDGDEIRPLNRIQSPSDIVNGLGVGAYTFDGEGKKIHAHYSCIGEGREGCKVKPDIAAFGGCAENTFHGVGTDKIHRYITAGTSFASPLVAGMAGRIMANSDDITPQMARTLLIHTAMNPYKHPESKLGYGCIPESEDNILNCTDKKVTVLYNGKINPTQALKLPIPLPDFGDYKGVVELTWTISTLVDPNILDSDGYTSYCIAETFYPNSEKFSMSKDGGGNISVNINTDIENINRLKEQGYKLSKMPKSESGNNYKTEEDRRLDMKWDTVVRRAKNKKILSLSNPFLVIHGISRSSLFNERIKFSIAVTISISSYSGNLYNDILNKYKVLQPIKLRNQNEIMIKI